MDISRRHMVLAGAAASLGCSGGGQQPRQSNASDPAPQALTKHVIDLHCDTPMLLRDGSYDLGTLNERGEVDIPRMRMGGMTAVFFSVYTSATRNTELEALREALEIMDTICDQIARFPADLALATSSAEIEEANRAGQIAILLGVEGGHMINASLGVLGSLYRLGARYLTLTHSKDTAWAGSSGSDANRGLSEFGREVIAEMNRLGMMVDISHVSDQTFWDVIESSSAPVIASHSSVRAIAPHLRNMTDDMIRAVAENGGVVHINYYNTFLDGAYAERSSAWNAANPEEPGKDAHLRTQAKLAAIGRPPLATVLDHFDHAVRVGGVDAVGLGSDFDGVGGELPEGMEDISKVPNIREGLAQRGYSEDQLDKIMGLNSLRVFRAVESAAKSGPAA